MRASISSRNRVCRPIFRDLLHNKLLKILGPAKAAAKPAAKPEPKPPRALTRVAGVEKYVRLGFDLLELRFAIKNNREYGRQVRQKFDVDEKLACRALQVAKAYGQRPEVFSRLSWNALIALASPTLPAAVREALETRIKAGQRVGAPEVRAAREALKASRPRCQAQRMAA